MSRRAIAAAAVATVVGATLLSGLGFWQLRRLEWKTNLLAEVEARAHAAPVAAPPPASWAALNPADYEYRHVRLEGRYDYARQVYVFRSLGKPRGRFGGPGYLVMTPLTLASGESVIVNRGFVPQERKVDAASGPSGAVTVDGLMRATEDRTWFTPADDPAKGDWYTRDVEEIAKAMQLGPHAPFSLDADAGPDPLALPEGGETILSFPNNHLSYAFTWFGMAVALVAVFAAWTWSQIRKPGA